MVTSRRPKLVWPLVLLLMVPAIVTAPGCSKNPRVEIQNLTDVSVLVDLNDGEQSLTVESMGTASVALGSGHHLRHIRATTLESSPRVYDLRYQRNPHETLIKVRVGGPPAERESATDSAPASSPTPVASPR